MKNQHVDSVGMVWGCGDSVVMRTINHGVGCNSHHFLNKWG